MKTLKVVIFAFVLLLGGYFFLNHSSRSEEVHWVEEVALHDGTLLDVQRSVALSYSSSGDLSQSAQKWPNHYSFSFFHPNTAQFIEWSGDYGFNPILLDFHNGTPYLVILQNSVYANLRQFGCTEIPYIFFRYESTKNRWEQISSIEFPSVISQANLTAFYDGGYIHEGMRFAQNDVAARNNEEEGAGTGGYFTRVIPKNFNSWTYKHKNEHRNGHHKDGCRSSN